MRPTTIVPVLLLAIAGCAADQAPAPRIAYAPTEALSASTPLTQQDCHRESRMGSNIPITICGTRASTLDESNEEMRKMKSTVSGYTTSTTTGH